MDAEQLRAVEDRIRREREAVRGAGAGGRGRRAGRASEGGSDAGAQCAKLEEEIRQLTLESAMAEDAGPADMNPFLVASPGEGAAEAAAPRAAPRAQGPSPGNSEERSARGSGGGGERTRRRPESPARSGEVRYLSPIYRSASPSRRVGPDGVRISSFGRSPRFADVKQWVPGPGKYEADVSGFAPRSVPASDDLSGLQGHTWADVGKGPGGRAVERPDSAAVTSTALVLVPPSGAGADVGAGVRAASPSREEKHLRATVASLRRELDQLRTDVTRHQAVTRSENGRLSAQLQTREQYLESGRVRLQAWRDASHALEVKVSELGRACRAAGASVPAAVLRALHEMEAAAGDVFALGKTPLPPPVRALREREDREQHQQQQEHEQREPRQAVGAEEDEEGGGLARAPSFRTWSTLPESVRSELAEAPSGATLKPTKSMVGRGITEEGLKALSAKVRVRALQSAEEDGQLEQRRREEAELTALFGASAAKHSSHERVPMESAVAARARSPQGSSPAALPGPQPGSPAVRAQGAAPLRVRRVTVGEVTLDAHLDAKTASVAAQRTEGSVSDKLYNIFEHYSRFGGRLDGGEVLKNSQFYRFVREADLLGPGRLAPQDVDLAFTRNVTRRLGAGAGMGSRMTYDAFIDALAEMARKLYGDGASGASGGASGGADASVVDPAALKQLLEKDIFPLYERLRRQATFVLDVVRDVQTEDKALFNEQFNSADTAKFLYDYTDAFQSLFVRYARRGAASAASASASAPPASSSASAQQAARGGGRAGVAASPLAPGAEHGRDAATPSEEASRRVLERQSAWAAARDTENALGLPEFYALCSELKIMGPLLTRHELTSIFREAQAQVPEALTFPEFVETLALVAFHCFKYADATARGGTGALPHVVDKLKFLFFSMNERGAKFLGDELRLVRDVVSFTKRRLRESHRESQAVEDAKEEQVRDSVARLLEQSVVL